MTWQEVVGHINSNRIRVESKSGNQYPAETEREILNEIIYEQLTNSANTTTYWAWVKFETEAPLVKEVQTGAPKGGPPKSPPGEQ